jgi:hypothetical protein
VWQEKAPSLLLWKRRYASGDAEGITERRASMKQSVRRLVAIAVMTASLLGVARAWAQLVTLPGPTSVSFVGTIQPFAEKKEGDLDTLIIYIDGEKLLFNVTEVYTEAGRDPVGLLLSHIFPPELYLSGPAKRLEPIKDSANLGKRFTIQGFLFVSDNMLAVMAVKVK